MTERTETISCSITTNVLMFTFALQTFFIIFKIINMFFGLDST